MPHEHEVVVRRLYEAQSRGDIDGYIRSLAEDFVLHIPGRSRIAGDYRGEAEIRRHFREIAALSNGTFRTEVHDVVAGDEHVMALVAAWAERDGVKVALPRAHAWHIREGCPAELWLLPVDQYAFDEYWGTGGTG